MGTSLLLLIIIVLFVSAGAYLYFTKPARVNTGHDPYKETVNDTNYNLDTMDKEDIAGASSAEAREIVDKVDKGDLSSLSPNDYHQLKDKMKD